MPDAASPKLDDSPDAALLALGVQSRAGERLLWTGKPVLVGYGTELLYMYPIFLVGGASLAILGWWAWSWAAGAGALWNFRSLGLIIVCWLGAFWLLIAPLAWPRMLRRSSYALTTHRLIIRQPALLVLWPRVRSLESPELQSVRLKCIHVPEETGDIYYGIRWWRSELMERVPHPIEVVALIRQTLVPPPAIPEVLDISPSLRAAIQGQLHEDERLVWAGRPLLRVFFAERQIRLLLFLGGVGGLLLAIGWLFYGPLVGLGLSMLALLSPLPIVLVRLHRTWYALTTKRVLIHKPKFWIFWMSNFSLDAPLVGKMQVVGPYIVWGWKGKPPPDEVLLCDPLHALLFRPQHALGYVPQIAGVAELIRQTLVKQTGNAPEAS